MLLKAISLLLPWKLKRIALRSWFGFKIHPDSYIGLSWVFPKKLIMDQGAKIGHFTIAVNLDLIRMCKKSSIGRSNWITGYPSGGKHHFQHQHDRKAELLIGESASITKKHHLDCTNVLEIGKFATIAGYSSQFLTHSINLAENRQDSAPIIVGEYAFVGTNVVVLGGASLPPKSVLGAKSLLNKKYTDPGFVYAGVPARPVSKIPANAKYFSRAEGFVF